MDMLYRSRLAALLLAVVSLLLALPLAADPVSTTPRITFSGNMDFVVTGGSLRTGSNAGNACAVGSSDTATLAGIPVGSSVVAAYLYWAGSGPTPDNNVSFNGVPVAADRTFSETYAASGYNLQFFSGFEDVTALVSGNGSYTFGDLSVETGNLGGGQNYCSVQAVLAGWGLVVVYENPTEPLRLINLFDGFEQFRGSQIDLAPSNFVIPGSGIDGKIGILSWEGDVENSATLNGVAENLVFNGQNSAPTVLTDGLNPVNNQFNSTVNTTGASNTWGVDFDVYDISSLLSPGDTSADTTYSSGGDLVMLSLQLVSVTNEPAANLQLSKTHSGDFSNAGTNTWWLDVASAGPSVDPGPISISDTLAAGLTYTGFSSADGDWSCSASGQDVLCTHPGPLAPGSALASVGIEFDADSSVMPAVGNTATVSSPLFDYNASDDSASDSANVLAPDIAASVQTVVDLNGGAALPGDTLQYRVRISEANGASIDNVLLAQALFPQLTNLTIVDAAGGTDSSTGTAIAIADISVPAGGFVEVIFEADIVANASLGDVISMTADLSIPVTGDSLTAPAPDVVVGQTGTPASGIKPLYFGEIAGSQNSPTLPMVLSRTPLTGPSTPDRVRIRRQDNDRVWSLSPALQSDFGIDAADIPVYLQLRRSGSTANRNIRVSIEYTGAATGLFGCVDATLSAFGANALSSGVTREFVFTVPRTDAACNPVGAAPLTLPAGTQIQVRVDNDPGPFGSGRSIYVYPYSDAAPLASRAEIPATTVINVDSLQSFDAAYGGGNAQTTFSPGTTVFLRSQVSDPFGTFDIAAVSYEVLDANGAVAASGPMPQVFDSGAASAIYEVALTLPGTAATGTWTVNILAVEGTEGTVSHSAAGTFTVSLSNVLLEKLVSPVSDPVSGTVLPKSIPLAIHEYVIRATNLGPTPLDADSIVVRDDLPSQMRLYLGVPADPVTFVDGAVSSGLSVNFTGLGDASDDISFSNDGGSTFIVPSVDVEGFDQTVPPINYLEIRPTGTFNAPAGSGDPSFELRFRMRLE